MILPAMWQALKGATKCRLKPSYKQDSRPPWATRLRLSVHSVTW
ncbi:Uncharacterised protein [Vibrio cholerae]|nr:Uncharacterised protein [Vibrio cholerae]